MKEAKFKIGDRVKTVIHDDLILEVMDAFYSIRSNMWFYEVRDHETMVDGTYGEESLELAPAKEYSMSIQIDIANNVVIATMYESEGKLKVPIHKGHGHLIHQGAFGIAQAASYACMRLYKSMEGDLR